MMADDKENKGGYTSVTLGDELFKTIDKHSADTGMDNRSLMIRLILQQYYKLKENGVDILKRDVDKIVKRLK
jgi:metal-responsive CopG/Arc/MetJ family transcriptional regulator